jgi:hypothetical protein
MRIQPLRNINRNEKLTSCNTLIKINVLMDKANGRVIIHSIWITIIISFFLLGCGVTNRIIEKNDIVYGAKRLELKFVYQWQERRSPITYMEQTVVKEITNSGTNYQVFDAVTLKSSSFNLEDKVFLIIDNEVYPMVIERKELEGTRDIDEKKEDIKTSDSTRVSVVTGYSLNNRKITRFSYTLSESVVARIKSADRVSIRYYTGPEMLTVKLRAKRLRKLKKLIGKV